MQADYTQWHTYGALCTCTLGASLTLISRTLVPSDTIDRAMVPAAIGQSYDEVLFGGILFRLNEGELRRIETPFHICFFAMCLWNNDGFALIGPYLPDEVVSSTVQQLLIQNQIALDKAPVFLEYFPSLPVLADDTIVAVFSVIAHGQYRNQPTFERAYPLTLSPDSPSPCPVLEEDSFQQRADNIARRYAVEREVLQAICRGDFEAIVAQKSNISLNRLTNRLRNEKNLAIIFNTLARKSIESVQVHPYHIDAISAKWSMRIEQCVSVEALNHLRREMLHDYCRLVQTHSLANYSPNVRAMLNYIQFNISEKISLEDLSKRLDVNASYLSQQFNKEVGKGLPEYVAEKRVVQAKRLLGATKALSVSQISAATGFQDANYFIKVFKKFEGCTPARYREKVRQSE